MTSQKPPLQEATPEETQGDSESASKRERRPANVPPSEFAYQFLKEQILQGYMPDGERLVEEPLGRRLGVSRTPIREALVRLEAERLVRRDARGGVVVARLNPAEIEDLYAVRSVLEGLSARLATRMMIPRDHVRLAHVQGLLEEATAEERFDELADLNLHFHSVILQSTRNEALIGFMGQIHDILRGATGTTLAFQGRAAAAMKEHRAMIAALKDGNPKQAEKTARDHIDAALNVRLLIHLKDELGGIGRDTGSAPTAGSTDTSG